MSHPDTLRHLNIPLAYGPASMPAVGFGTLIPDPVKAKAAIRIALETGFRHLDCAERYGNEDVVGEAISEAIAAGVLNRGICSSPPSCGTTITAPSGSLPRWRPACAGCGSRRRIAI